MDTSDDTRISLKTEWKLPYGLAVDDQDLITQRYAVLQSWLRTTIPEELFTTELLDPHNHSIITDLLSLLESRYSMAHVDFSFLLPLAQALSFVDVAARIITHTCRNYGWFDYPTPGQRRPVRIAFDILLPKIQALFKTVSDPQQGIYDLVANRLCRNKRTAQQLVRYILARPAKPHIRRCWEQGLFDKENVSPDQPPEPPPFEDIYRSVQELLQYTNDPALGIQALVDTRFCRNRDIAQLVLGKLMEAPSKTTLFLCWKQGLFDIFEPTALHWSRPPQALLEAWLLPLIETMPFASDRERWLKEQNICPTDVMAKQITEEFKKIEQRACGLARGWLLAYARYGLVGVLYRSPCPWYDELCALERLCQTLNLSNDNAAIGECRQSIAMLHHFFHSLPSTAKPSKPAHHQWLLACYAPSGHTERQALRKQLSSSFRAYSAEKPPDSAKIIDAFLSDGIYGIIDSHTDQPLGTTRRHIHQHRIDHLLTHHLQSLPTPHQQTIRSFISDLQEVIKETGIAFPLEMLLDAMPLSSKRYRFSARLSWSPRNRSRKNKKDGSTYTPHPEAENIDRLVQALAHKTRLPAKSVRYRILGLVLYGTVGVLTLSARHTACDARIISYIRLLRLGHVERAYHWGTMYDAVLMYAKNLGLPLPSSHIVRTIYNSQMKWRRWHGGVGAVVMRVRQRASLNIALPLLHERWTIQPLTLILSADKEIASTTYYLLVVIDLASGLPIGIWVCKEPPTADDVGLALYDAIWHPWNVQWPLRGVPQNLYLPDTFQHLDFTALNRATSYLLTTVAFTKAEKRKRHPIIQRIRSEFPAWLAQHTDQHQWQPWELHKWLTRWMRTAFFQFHRQVHVPPSIAKHGVALPGHDTPAAGWLLPQAESVTSIPNGVIDGAAIYHHALVRFPAGLTLAQRRHPWPIAQREYGIFIESPRHEETIVEYLTLEAR